MDLNVNYTLKSPDNWLVKAGAHIDMQGNLHLPYKFLLVSLAAAAEAVVSYRDNDSLLERHKNALIIATCVRAADTAYYTKVAEMLRSKFENRRFFICHNCLRGQLWPNKMKKLRQKVNSSIIHGMDKGEMIKAEDLSLAIEYYDEMLTHNLVPSVIKWEDRTGIRMCGYCEKKNNPRKA